MQDNFTLLQNTENKKISDLIIQRWGTPTPAVFIKTYGCQQNYSDSEKIKGILSNLGFNFTEEIDKADFILFNTCAVREHAEDRVFGNVGAIKNIKKKKPNLFIALCGCMMEQDHVKEKIKYSFPFVDLVFGTNCIDNIPNLIYNVLFQNKRLFETGVENKKVPEKIPVVRQDKVKALVPIMYGCDNFCSYCVVPYVRGREKSRAPEHIINEIKNAISSGYKEILLLGQNVNSYGKNLEEKINFSVLLKMIDTINGEFWVRFMTSHPKDASKELIDVIAESRHICKSIHLPFQSGNDTILQKMNRKYSRKQYIDIINYAKEKIPGLLITSDVIVGFPGETYEEFSDTLSLVKEVGFSQLFTFIYSKRKGTKAAKMLDPVLYKEKSKWFSELLNVQAEISDSLHKSMVGKTEKVLVEKELTQGGLFNCRTSNGIAVQVFSDEDITGEFINVLITDYKRSYLIGKII